MARKHAVEAGVQAAGIVGGLFFASLFVLVPINGAFILGVTQFRILKILWLLFFALIYFKKKTEPAEA